MVVNESFDDFFIWQESRQGFKTKYQNPWSLIIVATTEG